MIYTHTIMCCVFVLKAELNLKGTVSYDRSKTVNARQEYCLYVSVLICVCYIVSNNYYT